MKIEVAVMGSQILIDRAYGLCRRKAGSSSNLVFYAQLSIAVISATFKNMSLMGK